MSMIKVTDLTFAYEGSYDRVFENVDFQIDTAWRLGLVGRNGRGKTTLLKLFAGELPFRGSIDASVDFEYFPYAYKRSSTPEELMYAVCPQAEKWEFERELNLLGVREDAWERTLDTLSGGERTKILLAALFSRENAFLLLDEPTNHLDRTAAETVARYLRAKRGFILVSHDRELLDACTDHTLSINRANIEVQSGSFSVWFENKQRKDQAEEQQNRKLVGEIRRLQDAAARTSEWSGEAERAKKGTKNSGLRPDRGYIGHKAAKMMQRAKNIERRRENAIEEKSALLKNIETAEELKLSPLAYRSERILETHDFSVCYSGKPIFEKLNVELRRGERLALTGVNGCGKSSVIRALCGEAVPYDGTLARPGDLKISYVPQDCSQLSGTLGEYAAAYGISVSLYFAILRKMDFERVMFEKDLAEFSEGQKKKAALARSLCESAHLYVWDEPLSFVDVFSRIQLEELILKFCPTLLFVEHDGRFVSRIATRTAEIVKA